MEKRVFKLKTFARWAKNLLSDDHLCIAAQEIINGRFEANLGQGLCKKRIAIVGRGKRGSTRTLVAKESRLAIFYIVGRQKSDPGTDFTATNIAQAQILGQSLQAVCTQALDKLVNEGVLKEICHAHPEN